MSTPDSTSFLGWAERALGLGDPRPPSRFWVVYASSLVVFCAGLGVWYAISGRWDGSESFSVVGAFFLGLWVLADTAGSFLHARDRTTRGRELRVLGYAIFFPLMLVSYLAAFRSGPTSLLVVESIVVGGWFVWVAFRLGRHAWRRE
jgi:hypothetical protein